MTTWTARRVGKRILCGRQVPPGGPYACMGEIATLEPNYRLRLRTGAGDSFRGRRFYLDEASACMASFATRSRFRST